MANKKQKIAGKVESTGGSGPWPKGEIPAHLVGKGWQKGVSGNPNGRPKGAKTGLAAKMRQLAESQAPKEFINAYKQGGWDLGDSTIDDLFLLTVVNNALQGDIGFAKLFLQMREVADMDMTSSRSNNLILNIIGVSPQQHRAIEVTANKNGGDEDEFE